MGRHARRAGVTLCIMKLSIFSVAAVLCITTGAMADPDIAPVINHQIKELTKAVADDLAAGKLSQADADELNRDIQHVQSVENSEPELTVRTRRDLREDLSKIDADLKRKEAAAAANASASPAATP
jgi:hypothetical protein